MDTLLLIAIGLSAACLAARTIRPGPLRIADIANGLLAALIGIIAGHVFAPGAGADLALLVTCGLALGLESLVIPEPKNPIQHQ